MESRGRPHRGRPLPVCQPHRSPGFPTMTATTEGKGNLSIPSKPAAPSTDEIKAPPNPVSDIVGRIAQKMADKKDTSDDIQTLEDFDMEPMLEVLTRLRNIGYFEG